MHAAWLPVPTSLSPGANLHMARCQCPTKVVLTEDLPLGHSGKIGKLALQQWAVQMSATP